VGGSAVALTTRTAVAPTVFEDNSELSDDEQSDETESD
jgi:hypothetical protein